jgi:DNA (cytosine-5)-methyltransferase 1
MNAYYNEFDPVAAQWLRNLIAADHIADGIVDERSIEDVLPSDIKGFTQCHFFAGIGTWSLALRRAGWSDDRPVWTGSCPCQPFSAAGQGAAFADERHLWPAFHHLIAQCRPPIIFGEQVASKAVEPWIDLVHADLEAMGYAFGCVPFPAAGVGAPHIRDRLYWVADSAGSGPQRRDESRQRVDAQRPAAQRSGEAGGLADTTDQRLHGRRTSQSGYGRNAPRLEPERLCNAGGLGNANREPAWRDARSACAAQAEIYGENARHDYRPGHANGGFYGVADSNGDGFKAGHGVRLHGSEHDAQHGGSSSDEQPGPVNGHWRDADWLFCRDGRWRAVEPGLEPLVNGAASRVGRLRAYGNAICAQAAEEFVRACA